MNNFSHYSYFHHTQASKDNPSILLEADGHLSVLALFSNENSSSSWRTKPEAARRLETAAFELLSQLCAASQKGRQAVSGAEHFSESLNKALEVISCLIPRGSADEEAVLETTGEQAVEGIEDERAKSELEESEIVDEATSPKNDQQEGDDNVADAAEKEEEEVTKDPQVPSQKPTREPAKNEKAAGDRTDTTPYAPKCLHGDNVITLPFSDSLLEVAAFGFVSSLIQIKTIRNEVLTNYAFVTSCCALAVYFSDSVLQQEAVSLLTKLAPFVSNEATNIILTTDVLASTFLRILKSENDVKTKDESFSARLQGRVVSGILCIFDSMSSDVQVDVLRQVVLQVNTIIKNCAVSRTVKNADEQRGAAVGELACGMSYLLLHARGVLLAGKVVSPQMLVTLAHVIQWRFDPKTVLQDVEVQFWNATATHCVLLISSFVIGSQQNFNGIKLGDLPGVVLMVARPGKAPRKAIDFCSALQKLIEVGDAAASVAAQRILDRLAL